MECHVVIAGNTKLVVQQQKNQGDETDKCWGNYSKLLLEKKSPLFIKLLQ